MTGWGMWHIVSGPPNALLDRRPPDYVDNGGISLRKYLELAVNDPTKHRWAYECIFVVEEQKWSYAGHGGVKTVCDEVIFAHGWDLSEMIVNLNYYDFDKRRQIERYHLNREIPKLTIDPNRIKKPWKICGLDKLHWSCLSNFSIPGISLFKTSYEELTLAESQWKYNELSI